MSDTPQGPGWWQASDGQWYPPEQAPAQPATPPPAPSVPPPLPGGGPATTPGFAGASSGAEPQPAAPGAAFNYGWLKFQQNLGDIIVAAIIGFVIFVVIFAIGWFVSFASLRGAADTVSCRQDFNGITRCDTSGGGFFWFFLASAVQFLIFWLGSFMLQMIIIRASLAITYGRKVETKNLFSTDNLGPYLVASLIVAVLAMIGFFLCIIPAFIVLFFSQFFGYFILDKDMGAMDAIKASMQLVNKNIGTLVGFFIAVYIAIAIGTFACFIGLLVAWPVTIIATGYMYRRLQGEPVAP